MTAALRSVRKGHLLGSVCTSVRGTGAFLGGTAVRFNLRAASDPRGHRRGIDGPSMSYTDKYNSCEKGSLANQGCSSKGFRVLT